MDYDLYSKLASLDILPFWHPARVNKRINDHISKWWSKWWAERTMNDGIAIFRQSSGQIIEDFRL
jgi:hypothetical protein